MSTVAITIEQEIERLNVLTRVDEKCPKRLKNFNKFSTYLTMTKVGFALNEKGKKELKTLQQRHAKKEEKKRGIFFEPRTIKCVYKEEEFESTFYKYCEKVSEENDNSISLDNLAMKSSNANRKAIVTLASVVENWQNGSNVYCASKALLQKYNLRELPKTGKLKKIKNELFFEPYYLFEIKSDKSLLELQRSLKKMLPNTIVSYFDLYERNFYWQYYRQRLPYLLTCYNKIDASLVKLLLDVEVSAFDRSDRP